MGLFSLPLPSFRKAVAAAGGFFRPPHTLDKCLLCVTGVQSWHWLQAGSWLWSGEGICSITGCVKEQFPFFSEKGEARGTDSKEELRWRAASWITLAWSVRSSGQGPRHAAVAMPAAATLPGQHCPDAHTDCH